MPQNSLVFPADHDAKSGMWLTLVEYQYSRPTINANFTPTPTGTTVQLPIPSNLQASYSADWSTETSQAIVHLMEEGGRNLLANKDNIRQSVSNILNANFAKNVTRDNVKEWASTGMSKLGEIGSDVMKAGASDLITSLPVVNQIAAANGVARNPWLAATFTGVGFRSFPFAYNFFPKSLDESKTLEKIYKALKYGMHPSYDERFANNLFKYPNMYAVLLTPNTYLFEFGFCIIKDITINYHKEGAPIYFNDPDKPPASMSLNFTIQEIEIVTKESIDPNRASTDPNNGGSAAVVGALQGRGGTDFNPTTNPAGRVVRGR